MKNKKQLRLNIFCLAIAFLLFYSSGYASYNRNHYVLSGKTMGTFYTIKFISKKKEDLSIWKSRVTTRLKEVNKKLSMYDPRSEISLFNRTKIKTPITASTDFHTILVTAKNIYQMTDGAWDGTVKPLVDLWGFGVEKKANQVPGSDEITQALSKIGFGHMVINEGKTISKTADITLDLGSIAKGYGVDAIAAMFTASGIRDILVEIGGELYASGKNKNKKSWSVGINHPDAGQNTNQGLYGIIRLNNQAIATSGNYRNFFKIKGRTYSHIIDPKTGYPIDNGIVSASVISKNCTFSDGLATALMVMDLKKGIRLINRLENTECLILQKKGTELIRHTSQNLEIFLVK